MAVTFNYDRLTQLSRGRFEDFLSEYHKQFLAGGGDPNKTNLAKEALDLFNGYRANPQAGGMLGGGGGLFGMNRSGYATIGGSNILQGTSNFMLDMMAASERGGGGAGAEFDSLQKAMSLVMDRGGLHNMLGIWKSFKTLLKDEVILYLRQQAQTYEAINEQMGMSGDLAKAFRSELMLASPDVIKWGVTFNEMSTSVAQLVRSSGKFKLLSADTIEEMALASKFTENMTQFVAMGPNFEKIGLGVRDMSLLIEKMGLKSMTLGLNARETTKLVNDNLKQLNAYGFREGVDGLNRMAQKSIEFRMNMESVFKLADAVWEPEKALELVANLQVIGGAFGDLNDPIKMMYMATNNVEGLQDALIGAAKSLATYNAEQGRFEITGVNLRRAKAMADEMGISMEQLTNGAIAAMERQQAASDLLVSGLVVKDEDKEFLTNLARMEGGKMVIEVPETLRDQLGLQGEETQIAIEDMNQKQIDFLLSQKKAFEEMTMEDVARQQVTLMENINREVSRIRAYMRVNIGEELGNIIERTIGADQATMSKEVANLGNAAIRSAEENKKIFQQALLEEFPDLEKEIQSGMITSEADAIAAAQSKQSILRGTESPPPVTGTKNTTDVNVNMTAGDAVVDTIKRAIWNDPQWQEDFKKSFLNPN